MNFQFTPHKINLTQKNNSIDLFSNEIELKTSNSENIIIEKVVSNKSKFNEPKFTNGCSVCGGEEWCETDGCPLDPQ